MLLATNQLKLHLGVGFGEEMRLMPNSISRFASSSTRFGA
jgi:hypothetical protein